MIELNQAVKYLLEGLAVAVVAYYIPQRTMNWQEVALLGLTAAATFALLDYFAPSVATGARRGSGFAIGQNLITAPGVPQAGGNPTPMPYEWYHPLPESDDQQGGAQAQAQAQVEAPVASQAHPYKLVDGLYADKILLAGYNPDVQPYNQAQNDIELASYGA